MAKGLRRSLSRGPALLEAVIKETLNLGGTIEVDGATGVGFGTVVLAGLPQGNFMLLGAVAYVQLTGPGTGHTADFEGDYSIGSAPTADATLSGAEVDIVPSTALAAATANVSPLTRGLQSDGSLCGVVLDNTAGDLELNLNVLIDDADISADDVDFTLGGSVHLVYTMLGDD